MEPSSTRIHCCDDGSPPPAYALNTATPLTHAQFLSELATCRVMPFLARQAILGLRNLLARHHHPEKPLSVTGPTYDVFTSTEADISACTPTMRSYGRRATPLSAHVRNDAREGRDGSPVIREN